MRYDPKPGNEGTPADEADLRLEATMKDVRMSGSLADYPGEMAPTVSIRITERDNAPLSGGPGARHGPGPHAGLLGAVHHHAVRRHDRLELRARHNAEGLLANAVKERPALGLHARGRRRIFDGGTDSDADTTTDDACSRPKASSPLTPSSITVRLIAI